MTKVSLPDTVPRPPELPAGPMRLPLVSVGEIIGGSYRILGRLGAGGMGEVFEAEDLRLKRHVAIKVARAGSSLRMEAQALAAIRHPGVCAIYAAGEHHEVEYVAMEFVRGATLRQHMDTRVAAGGRFSTAEVLKVAQGIAEALTVVHSHGLVHRDIKPGNIMLAPGDRCVLVDFGLFETVGQAGSGFAGTPGYIAPEAIQRQSVGFEADVFALGAVVFKLLTGRLPFDGNVAEMAEQTVAGQFADLRALRIDVPEDLVALIEQLLSRDAHDRPDAATTAHRIATLRDRLQRSAKRPFTVLVVDDDESARKMFKLAVSRAIPDAHVRVAESALVALRSFEEDPPDAMLLDLNMPAMSGVELCMYLRGTGLGERCAVVAVSAGGQPADRDLLRDLGVTRFVSKGERTLGAILEHLDEIRRESLG